MKNILIYEYITGGGLINEDLNHNLLFEANLMLESLISDFSKSDNIKYNYLIDYRLKKLSKIPQSIVIKNSSELYNVSILEKFDFIIPILPESNLLLYKYSKFLEENNFNKILSSSSDIHLFSDKKLFSKFCLKFGINHPKTYMSTKNLESNRQYVLKERYGVSCSHVEIIKGKEIKNFDNTKYIIQDYVKGASYSASVYFYKHNYVLLTINKHTTIIQSDGRMKIASININKCDINILKIYNILRKINKNLPTLFGYIGLDFIVKQNEIYLIEVNPRFTTSFTKINQTVGINHADFFNYNYLNVPISGKTCKISL